MDMKMLNVKHKLLCDGYEDVVILSGYSYDDAIIGVTEDNRAVYDYDKMIEWLAAEEGWSVEECIEWIDYNTLSSLPYWDEKCPVIMYPLRNLKEATK